MYRTPSGVFCVILETEYEKEEYYEPRYLEGDNLKETGATYSAICSRNLQNLNGLQAQFQPYVHIGFRNRMTAEDFQEGSWQEELTRQWSIRRTVHAYLKSEIPLYIHEGRLASTDYLKTEGRDGFSSQTKQKYHQLILEAFEQGPMTREDLKDLCRGEKMTQEEEKLVFNAWGGLLRYMVERGEIYNEEKFTRSMG